MATYSNQSSPTKKPKVQIKKLRLIVRTPPPLISHPGHILPTTTFGGSLASFMASYVALESQDLNNSTLHKMAHRDAKAYNHLERLRRSGRSLPRFDPEFDAAIAAQKSASESNRAGDIWDDVVAAVIERGRKKRLTSMQVAAQTARCMKEHWDDCATAIERANAAEEKRIRALAKATLKMVTNEWKKAVFVRCLFSILHCQLTYII